MGVHRLPMLVLLLLCCTWRAYAIGEIFPAPEDCLPAHAPQPSVIWDVDLVAEGGYYSTVDTMYSIQSGQSYFFNPSCGWASVPPSGALAFIRIWGTGKAVAVSTCGSDFAAKIFSYGSSTGSDTMCDTCGPRNPVPAAGECGVSMVFETGPGDPYWIVLVKDDLSPGVTFNVTFEEQAFSIPPSWTCDPDYFGDGLCDCGCGAMDIDCGNEHYPGHVNVYDNCEASYGENWCCDTAPAPSPAGFKVIDTCHDCSPAVVCEQSGGPGVPPRNMSCGISTVTGDVGFLALPSRASPMGPPEYSCYAPDMYCYWNLTVANADNITIRLDPYKFERYRDMLEIWDEENNWVGGWSDKATFVDGMGNTVFSEDDTPSVLTLEGSSAHLIFTSSGDTNEQGFVLQFCGRGDMVTAGACAECPGGCEHGECFGGTCICEPGWFGPQCANITCAATQDCGLCINSGHCQWCEGSCQDLGDSCFSPSTDRCPCSSFSSCDTCNEHGSDFGCNWCFDSGMGECIGQESPCLDWVGDYCPDLCKDECNQQGYCDCSSEDCICNCYYSFTGDDCGTGVSNSWETYVSGFKDTCPVGTDVDFRPLWGAQALSVSWNGDPYVWTWGGHRYECPEGSSIYALNNQTFVKSLREDGSSDDNNGGDQFSVQPSPLNPSPVAFYGAAAVPSPSGGGDSVYIYGGTSDGGTTVEDTMHRFQMPSFWDTVFLSGFTPGKLWGIQLVYLPSVNTIYLFSGFDDQGQMDTSLYAFAVSSESWSRVQGDNGAAWPTFGRAHYGAVAVDGSGYVAPSFFIMGGVTAWGDTTDETWQFLVHEGIWEQWDYDRSLTMTSRQQFSAAYDQQSEMIIIYGGIDGMGTNVANVEVLDLVWEYWSTLEFNDFLHVASVPDERYASMSFYEPDTSDMWIFAGRTNDEYYILEDVMRYHPGPMLHFFGFPADDIVSPLGHDEVAIAGNFVRLADRWNHWTGYSENFPFRCAFSLYPVSPGAPIVTPDENLDGYIESLITWADDGYVWCDAPPFLSSEMVFVTIVEIANVVLPGKAAQPFRFFAGQSLTLDYAACPPGTTRIDASEWSWDISSFEKGEAPMVTCKPCPVGTASSDFDSDLCTACPKGTLALVNETHGLGASSCQPCPPGYWSGDPTAEACEPCEPGYYAGAEASVSCDPCPLTGYQPLEGQPECESCPDHMSMPDLQFGDRILHANCTCDDGYWGAPGDACTACDAESMICVWGDNTWPRAAPGYWRPDPNSALIFECVPAEACQSDLQCRAGYSGRMCSECDDGYYKLNRYCEKCPSGPGHWKMGLAGTIGFCVTLLLVYLAKPSSSAKAKAGRLGRKGGSNSNGFASISIGISFFQMVSLFSGFDVGWPASVRGAFSFASFTSFNIELLSPECEVEVGFYDKWQAMMLMPFAVAFIYLVSYLILILVIYLRTDHAAEAAAARQQQEQEQQEEEEEEEAAAAAAGVATPRSSGLDSEEGELDEEDEEVERSFSEKCAYYAALFVAGFLLFLTLIYVVLADSTASFFDCTRQSDGTSSLDADPSLFCYDSTWMSHLPLAIVGVVVYVIGVPAGLFTGLWSLRHFGGPERLAGATTTNHLIKRFRPPFYYWEVTILIRKLAIVFAAKFLSSRFILQSIFAIMVLFAALLFTAGTRPFGTTKYNVLEIVLLISSFCIMFSGILFANKEVRGGTRDGIAASVIVIMAISTLLLVYVLVGEVRQRAAKWCSKKVSPEDDKNPDDVELDIHAKQVVENLFPHDNRRFTRKLAAMDPEHRTQLIALLDSVGAQPSESSASSDLSSQTPRAPPPPPHTHTQHAHPAAGHPQPRRRRRRSSQQRPVDGSRSVGFAVPSSSENDSIREQPTLVGHGNHPHPHSSSDSSVVITEDDVDIPEPTPLAFDDLSDDNAMESYAYAHDESLFPQH